jgi:hypothetical protein
MCTVLGLVVIIAAIVGWGYGGYHFFNFVDSYDSIPSSMHWASASFLGSVMLMLIVFILILLGMACCGFYHVAPTIGCYVLGHI